MSKVYSPGKLKFLLNLFPPLLFSRVRLHSIGPGFTTMEVRVRRSILNRNFERSIFGGTIFSAADPWYALMYWQALAHRGVRSQVFMKKAEINFRKPALSHLTLQFKLEEADIVGLREELEREGKAERWHSVNAVDANGQICAEIRTLTHVRLRDRASSASV